MHRHQLILSWFFNEQLLGRIENRFKGIVIIERLKCRHLLVALTIPPLIVRVNKKYIFFALILFFLFDFNDLFHYLHHFFKIILGPILRLVNLPIFKLIDFLSNNLTHRPCLRLIFVNCSIANILIFWWMNGTTIFWSFRLVL